MTFTMNPTPTDTTTTPIVRAFDEAAVAWATAYTDRMRVAADPNLSDAGRQVRIQSIDSGALERFDEAEQAAHDALRRAQATLEPSKPTGDPAAQLLAETRQDRAWGRIKGYLDTLGDLSVPAELVREAVRVAEAGDQISLAAIRAEAADYLRSRGCGDQRDDVLDRIASVARPHLPADERTRLDRLDDITAVHEATVGAIDALRRKTKTHDTTTGALLRRTAAGTKPGAYTVCTVVDNGHGSTQVTRQSPNGTDTVTLQEAFPLAK